MSTARRAANAAMVRQPKAPRHGAVERQLNGTGHATVAPADNPSPQRPGKSDQPAAADGGDGVEGKHGSAAAQGKHAAPVAQNGSIAGNNGRAAQHTNGVSGLPVERNAITSSSRSQVAGQLHEHVRQQLQAPAPFPHSGRGASDAPPGDKLSRQHGPSHMRFSGTANGTAVRQADPPTPNAHANGPAEPRVLVVEPPRAPEHARAGSEYHAQRRQPPIMQFGTFTDERSVKSGSAAPSQPVNVAGHAFNQSVAAALGLAAAGPSIAVSPATIMGPASGSKSQQQGRAVAPTPAATSNSAPNGSGANAHGNEGAVVTDSQQVQNFDRQQQGARRGRGGSAHRGGRGPHRGRHSPVHSRHERDVRVLEVAR